MILKEILVSCRFMSENTSSMKNTELASVCLLFQLIEIRLSAYVLHLIFCHNVL